MILLDPGHRKSEAFQFVKLTFLNLCKHSETVVNFQNPKVFALWDDLNVALSLVQMKDKIVLNYVKLKQNSFKTLKQSMFTFTTKTC